MTRRLLPTAILLAMTIFHIPAMAENDALPSPAPLPASRSSTFNVGQIYVGGHIGFAIPTSIGRDDDEISFRDVAKTGFVIYADAMRQMNQSIGVGAEFGFRNYGQNDKKTWSNLTRYGEFEATYRALDLNLTGRLFFSRKAVRPFFGVLVGGELIMNSVDFTPNTQYAGAISATQYKTNNISPAFGVMTGAYFKAGRQTLASLQVRLNIVPQLKDDVISMQSSNGDTQSIAQNPHGNQTNISVTLGLHIGTQRDNRR